jgi:muramoyltetrapeptide carboxypeptidase LdcA involved in peptidoglycan recycling
MIIPKKLFQDAEARIIAPSKSLVTIPEDVQVIAKTTLANMGIRVSFAKHVNEYDYANSSSVASRIADLHEAFLDNDVSIVMTAIGGYNSNQLLDYIDFGIIRDNPKILIGYSDITALQNAIYAQTGMVTYSGPHFSSMGMEKGSEYMHNYFNKVLFPHDGPVRVSMSTTWSDEAWYIDQENRNFIDNDGYWVVNPANAQGTIVGGNLNTLQLLFGTRYMPAIKDKIVFIENGAYTTGCDMEEFDRQLESLLQQPDSEHIKAIVIGRFQMASGISRDNLTKIIIDKKKLARIPVIANVDFGHTMPMITFPIGGSANILVAQEGAIEINFIVY